MGMESGFVYGGGGFSGRGVSARKCSSARVLGVRSGFKCRTPSRIYAVAGNGGSEPVKSVYTGQETGLSASPRLGPDRIFEGIRGDIERRLPHYWNDWAVGFNLKCLSATLFLFFACFAPVIAFGALTSVLTQGALGVVEFIIAAGLSGVVYSVFCGQPLTIIGPTGLTLAFTGALFSYCQTVGLAFLPMYAWTGIWSSIFLLILGVTNSSDIIKFCTRFTDDVFNSLIAVTFVTEALKGMANNFLTTGADKTTAFMALTISLGTFLLGRFLGDFRKSRYLRRSIRTFLSDFGPTIAIATMSAIAAIPVIAVIGLQPLTVPSSLVLANSRPLLVDLMAVPMAARIAASIPAVLLTCLFFLDQNITVRVVNSANHRLRKGDSYHLDMFVLGAINLGLSFVGLPWMCAATVQSLNHIRALAYVKTVSDPNDANANPQEVIDRVLETRTSGFFIHALICASVLMLPLLKRVPLAVITGLFLFLGRNMMTGNEFLRRIKLFFVDPKLYPENSPIRKLGPPVVHRFTAIQLACLALLWTLKANTKTSLFFPSVIGMLMVIRSFFVGRVFSKQALKLLDGDFDYSEESENSHLELYEEPRDEAAVQSSAATAK
uniref:Bicarbonate transporter-like transmembrane domain-containing protein n=1 Tax=Rhodosorus marinus TaxID=101924 RepID=A0A7S2ZTC3_9RHOD|mmetsp:Transcript_29978/g.115111  ORF Transcript_29978/g.115111 Transcript_29978/m.115111 type:complete len:607 (+) Transcript_29978:109-1929(+)